MNLTCRCECGVELEAEDAPPATAELLWNAFDRTHPHSEQAAQARRADIAETAGKRWRDNTDGEENGR